jgi:hypothetical protein
LFLAFVGIVGVVTYIRVRRSPAFDQQPNQAAIRQPGQRRLGAPQPITLTGFDDLPFALLSQSAYQNRPGSKAVDAGACLDSDDSLNKMGWKKWPEFTDPCLKEQAEKVHLRAEVWSHDQTKQVAVAFAGTEVTNLADWRANLRWFLPKHQDEYTVIVKTFGQAFVDAFVEYSSKAGWQPSDVHLFSTGHSLGGGLAQEFAYSLPIDGRVPRVEKVYAFDPSPVTGFYSVKKSLRETNANNLATDRIYERGEILAIVRSITNYISPPSAEHPTIRQIRYNLFPTRNPIAGHSIPELACKLSEQLHGAGVQAQPAPPAAVGA